MKHRGPDGDGSFNHQNGILGHRRLSIIDIATGGQPMLSQSGQSAITFNGEIYNYLELKRDYLSDSAFNTHSDTEVLLQLLDKFGVEGIEKLNGMFAFCYWSIERRKLILARDPVGQKPLFYHAGREAFIFASELTSVALCPPVSLDLDPEALSNYLLFEGFLHPRTPLKDVRKLRPGHFLEVDLERRTVEERTYWNNPVAPEKPREDSTYLREFAAILSNSVDRHLRSDVEVGLFLSGGLDSTSLARAISKKREIRTFTIRHELTSFDESALARKSAEFYGTTHHEMVLTNREFLSDVDHFLERMDEPIADPGFLAQCEVARLARPFVKVVVGGSGGDEFFAGYAPFRAIGAYLASRWIPSSIVPLLQWLTSLPPSKHSYMTPLFKIQRFLRGMGAPPKQVLQRWIGSFDQKEIEGLLGNRFPTLYSPLDQQTLPDTRDLVSVLLHYFQNFYLPVCICNHADKATMQASLELRNPFMDTEIMRFANRLPNHLKFDGRQTKVILRRYLEGNAPPHVFTKPKQGFTVPIASWLTTSLRDWAGDLLNQNRIARRGIVDPKRVEQLWRQHQSRRGNHAKALWTLLVLENWLSKRYDVLRVERDALMKVA